MVKLFCAVVGEQGSVFPVDIDAEQTVGDLKKAVKKENNYSDPAYKLKLFLAKKGSAWLTVADVMKGVSDTTGLKPFDNAGAPLHLVGLSKKNLRFEVKKEHVEAKTTPVHVLVVAPEVESKRPAGDEFEHLTKRLKLIAPKTLTDFTKLSVNKNEFQLDSLRAKQNSDWPIVETPGLHTFWEGFGEFPLFYFVRMEEVVFWEVIKKLLFGKDRVVIIGSPGVGKSCFLMLIAFHLACTKNKKVLVIRRLKQREEKNAVVYFDGQGSYARLLNLSSNDILAIRSQTKGAIVLVDGFDQAQVEEVKNEYVPFSFLATSCQFDAKQDDSSRIVVLPAWRDADLLQYAKLTDWMVETGWRKTKRLEDSTWPKLVKKQYFYSGGSLREFCREREELQIRVASDCCSVKNGQAFDLVYNYGGGQSSGQVDRLRRHYITDCHEEAHYYDHRWWKLSVDSGYVLGELGRIIDSDKQLEVYQYAKSVGAGFHGVAYELLLHSAVRGAFAKRKPIVLKMREGSRYEKIEIRVPNVVCSGDDEASCYHHLSKLGKETYWHPNYPFFPFIDAVTTCKAFPGGSDEFDPIVAYIQVTIRTEKKFKQERLRRLNKEMDKNELLKGMKRAFVVVGPDSSVCKNFNLRNAPDSFLAMVGCFSPDQLKPEAS